MSVIGSVWTWLSTSTPAPSAWWLLAALSAGALLGLSSAVWRRTRLLATWVHETGHALAALLTGRRVTGIRLEADASGMTHHVGSRGLGRVITGFAGYPAPALAGAGVAVAVGSGHARWAVGAILAVAVLMLPLQRSWRGTAVTFMTGALGYVLISASPMWAVAGLTALAGYLLVASPRTVVELHRHRRFSDVSAEGVHSDADSLAAVTGLPAVVWEGLFLLVCGACGWWALSGLLG